MPIDLCAQSLRPFTSPVPAKRYRVCRSQPLVLIRPQCQKLWCWASVLEYLHHHYRSVTGTNPLRDQGVIASDVTGKACQAGCTGTPEEGCDRLGDLLSLLDRYGFCAGWCPCSIDDWQTLQDEVCDGRPVAFRAAGGGSAHFAAVSGWIEGGGRRYVEVMDPAGGTVRYLTLGRLRTGLPGWGRLSHLMFTRNPSEGSSGPRPAGSMDCSSDPPPNEVAQIDPARWSNPSLVALLRDQAFEVGVAPQTGWRPTLEEHLRAFLSQGAEAPEPLRGVEAGAIEVCGPIRMVNVETRLEMGVPGLEIVDTWGFALVIRGRGVGFFDLLQDDNGNWRLESLSFAPDGGRGEDRFVHELRRALAGLAGERALVLSLPALYETAVVSFSGERFKSTNVQEVLPLGEGFSYLRDAESAMNWHGYLDRLAGSEKEIAESLG